MVDAGSTDGTLDLSHARRTLMCFRPRRRWDWLDQSLLDMYGSGHWTLTVETGELFVYPHYEELELPLFCKYLNYVGSQAVPCVSIDMYAASPISRRGASSRRTAAGYMPLL